MFGYLNLNDPRKINDTEAQEANNVRVDRGYLEYVQWAVDETYNKIIQTPNARVRIDPTTLMVRRERVSGSGTFDDPIGISIPAALPTIGIVAGDPAYPLGDYQYAVTLSNATYGEESRPAILSVTVTAGQHVQFTAFPSYAATYPTKTALQWNIYRRPLGGDAFLFVASFGATAPVASYDDTTADTDLGVACDSVDNYALDEWGGADVITFYQGKIFFAAANTLRYSRTSNISAFPADFFETATNGIVALLATNEALCVLSTNDLFWIYGTDETSFIIKKIAHQKNEGASYFSARDVNGRIFFVGTSDQTISSYPCPNIFEVSGSISVPRTLNLSALFPMYPFREMPAAVLLFRTGQKDDRFWVLRHGGNLYDPTALQRAKYLAFDTIANGWLAGTDDASWSYRTKEFGKPGQLESIRRMFVTGEGQFNVEVWGDNTLVDTTSFNLAANSIRQEFTVGPNRQTYYSFRFVGQPGAKVFEYGRIE